MISFKVNGKRYHLDVPVDMPLFMGNSRKARINRSDYPVAAGLYAAVVPSLSTARQFVAWNGERLHHRLDDHARGADVARDRRDERQSYWQSNTAPPTDRLPSAAGVPAAASVRLTVAVDSWPAESSMV